MSRDEMYMRRAMELAGRGEGWCHPNPMVGAVIVKDDRIIGEGYHAVCGQLHAERNAIAALTESAEGATIYVTLEPCCHYGKTPPCTEAIIENKISRVVIGSRDPNPKVAGGGVKVLRDAGIEVVEDFLREGCDRLNPVFLHYIREKDPYVIMKYAMTADGKIATKTGASQWITGPDALARVHEIRHACMGIMVGIGTVLADDPMLNCRMDGGRDPMRIICDSSLRIPADSQICKTAEAYQAGTVIACAISGLEEGEISEGLEGEGFGKISQLLEMGLRIVNVPGEDGRVDLKKLMKWLGQEGIDSILLEGGGGLNESALSAGIVNEIRAFVAPKIFGGSAKSPVEGKGVELPAQAYEFEFDNIEQVGRDLMITCRLEKE